MTPSATYSTTIAPPALDELCINTLRFLAVDMVQKANSGHPGLPMGSASMAYALPAPCCPSLHWLREHNGEDGRAVLSLWRWGIAQRRGTISSTAKPQVAGGYPQNPPQSSSERKVNIN